MRVLSRGDFQPERMGDTIGGEIPGIMDFMNTPKKGTRIGVVSDTHLPDVGHLPMKMLGDLEKVDAIIHLGDFCDMAAYKEFQKIAPVIAVYGNMDCQELKAILPEKKVIEIQGHKLGLIHGWGPPKNLETRVVKAFGDDVEIVLFGHSHMPLFMKIEDKYVFNPGSPTLNRDATGTYGILDLDETINHQIIRLDE